jgi:hypothetical protein
MKKTCYSWNKSITKLLIIILIFLTICGTISSKDIQQKILPASFEPILQKKIVINELTGGNTNLLEDEDGDYSNWVELYNVSIDPVNLKGWYLSDDRTFLNKWMFSASHILNPGEHLVIYLSGKDRRTKTYYSQYHTNFIIDNSCETLFLSSYDRIIQDTLESNTSLANTSFGRSIDGIPSWKQFSYPTPGETNESMIPPPEFSLNSGFYTTDKPLIISAKNIPEGYELRYTINDGVTIDDQDQASNRYNWNYASNKSGIPYDNRVTIDKTSVIKARFYKGLTAGPEVVYTYFINENIDLPIVSLTTDPANLWSDNSGIYVVGKDQSNPNYLRDDWEVAAQFTYFADSSKQYPDINVSCQLRIFGSSTREDPNKSLAILSRNREIPNLFFNNNSETVYSLLLRAGGSDFPRTIIRDMITSELVEPLGLDTQYYQQAILFINGQYWGIQNIREKLNEEMIEDKYATNPKQLDLIFGTFESQNIDSSSANARNGTIDEYNKMLEFITTSNQSLSKNYNQVENYIDIDSFIYYVIVETFINNGDWPSNNVKAWKSWEPDSVWRWIIYDTDASYDTEEFWSKDNPYENKVIGNPSFNSIDRLFQLSTYNHIASIFQSLMQNEEFEKKFINSYEELLGVVEGKVINPDALLGTKRLLTIISTFTKTIEKYMPRQLTRWLPEYPSYMHSSELDFDDNSISRWNYQINILRSFAEQRPIYVAQFLQDMKKIYTPTGVNIIENGFFNEIDKFWDLDWDKDVSKQDVYLLKDNYVGRIQIADYYSAQNDPTGVVSLVHDEISLIQGLTYELSFSLKIESKNLNEKPVIAYLFKSSPKYPDYVQISIVPDTEWQTVKKIFTMNEESDSDARLQFRAGLLSPGTTLYIDNVSLMEME